MRTYAICCAERMTNTKRILIWFAVTLGIAVLGWFALVVAANIGIDTTLPR
jgi:hypothetical protein